MAGRIHISFVKMHYHGVREKGGRYPKPPNLFLALLCILVLHTWRVTKALHCAGRIKCLFAFVLLLLRGSILGSLVTGSSFAEVAQVKDGLEEWKVGTEHELELRNAALILLRELMRRTGVASEVYVYQVHGENFENHTDTDIDPSPLTVL